MSQQPASTYTEWHDTLADARFAPSSQAIRDYLALCEGLESPTPYHIWSFLSLMAALCGDNIALTHGPMGRERLNLGIVLTGIPAIRKSTALSVMQKFAEGFPIAYGPTDTAGQRQGIMSAMMPRWQKDMIDESSPNDISATTLEELAEFDSDSIVAKLPNPLDRKSSEIYFVAKELGRLISSNSRELFDFFTDGMDGETFHYQLKNQVIKIEKPLMNLLGATTPTSLGTMMPKGGESHGFLSRLIFVHAPYLDKLVPNPQPWSPQQLMIKESLHDKIMGILEAKPPEVRLTQAAYDSYEDLYTYQPSIVDLRLEAYRGRRAKHLLKVAALLALLRDGAQNASVSLIAADIRLSHALLVLTERTMDRAFYGLDMGLYSRVLCAVTELIEGSRTGEVSVAEIQAYAGHLAPKAALNDMLDSLTVQKKLVAKGSRNNETFWGLNQEAWDIGTSRLALAFRIGGEGIPDPDEFRTHKAGKPTVVIKKGDAG